MGDVQRLLIEDERLKLYDRDACSEIWRAAREYFVDSAETRLSDAWGSTRVAPVIQPIYDYLEDGKIRRNEPDFRFALAAIRKRDGVTFAMDIVIEVRFKGHREAILEIFKEALRRMESYAGCACVVGQPCVDHKSPNEVLLPA